MSVVGRLFGGRQGGWSTATLAERAIGLSRMILLALTLSFLLAGASGIRVGLRTQAWLYLALMIGIGLPHGGYEHVANLRGRGEDFQSRYLLAYLLLLAAAIGTFVAAPPFGLGLAVLVTALKGGHGGLQVLGTHADLDHLPARWQRVLAVVVRGGSIMTLALAFHPGDFSLIAAKMVRPFGGSLAPVSWAFAPGALRGVAIGWASLAAVHVGAGWWRGGGRGWRLDAFETLLLGAYFAVVPPILAVGVYFPCWYATRQVARMGVPADSEFDPVRALKGFVRSAALPWAGAVLVFGAVVVGVTATPESVFDWVALYSVAIAAIALPHVVVGSWLDRERGIWSIAA